MGCTDGQRHRHRCVVAVDLAIGQDDDGRPRPDRRLDPVADVDEGAPQPLAAAAGGERTGIHTARNQASVEARIFSTSASLSTHEGPP